MTFDDYVRSQIGARPTFTRGNYSSECKAWDAKYAKLLDSGFTGPIYHPKRAKVATAIEDAGTQFLRSSNAAQ